MDNSLALKDDSTDMSDGNTVMTGMQEISKLGEQYKVKGRERSQAIDGETTVVRDTAVAENKARHTDDKQIE